MSLAQNLLNHQNRKQGAKTIMAKANTTKAAAAKANTTKAAVIPNNPAFNTVLEKLRKAAGWDIIGQAPNFAAISTLGTTVMLDLEGKVIVANLSNDLHQSVTATADAKTIARVVVDIDQKAKAAVTNKTAAEAKKAAEAKAAKQQKTQEKKTMAPKKDDTKAAEATKATEAKAEKVIGKPIVNPAGTATPTFDALKKNAETDEKTKEKLKTLWEGFGAKYDFKVGNLTKALLAEGLWPASKDKDGDFKAGDDGLQVPVGYQKVYKEEKEQGIKGIGHLVNVAAATFGRHNMENAAKQEAAKTGPQGSPATADEKTLAKLLVQIEKLAIKIDAEDLKNYLSTSKAFAPAMAMIKEEEAALAAL